MKATEVIKKLEELVAKHGDVEVFSGGEDYPGKVSCLLFIDKKNANAYYGPNCIKIYARDW